MHFAANIHNFQRIIQPTQYWNYTEITLPKSIVCVFFLQELIFLFISTGLLKSFLQQQNNRIYKS